MGVGLFLWFLCYLYLCFNMHLLRSVIISLLLSFLLYLLFYSLCNIICSVWYDHLSPIQYVCSDMIHSYMLSLIWSDSIRSDPIQYNTIQYNTIQYNTIQYNTIKYNTIQSNTVQYNLLASLWYTHSNMLWSSLLCSLQPNPILSLARSSLIYYLHSDPRNF